MKYLIQQYTNEHSKLYKLTGDINKKYAESIGFQYYMDNTKRCTDRNIWWEKIAFLNEYLPTIEENSLVLYQDCDAIIINGDPTTALHTNSELGMVQLYGGMDHLEALPWYNAGVIILINTESIRKFLKKIWDRNDDNDERSINKELKSRNYRIDGKAITSLDTGWNCWDNNINLTDNICIKSWHGISYEDKLKLIKEYIKKSK